MHHQGASTGRSGPKQVQNGLTRIAGAGGGVRGWFVYLPCTTPIYYNLNGEEILQIYHYPLRR